jgi:hypothetical protein
LHDASVPGRRLQVSRRRHLRSILELPIGVVKIVEEPHEIPFQHGNWRRAVRGFQRKRDEDIVESTYKHASMKWRENEMFISIPDLQ